MRAVRRGSRPGRTAPRWPHSALSIVIGRPLQRQGQRHPLDHDVPHERPVRRVLPVDEHVLEERVGRLPETRRRDIALTEEDPDPARIVGALDADRAIKGSQMGRGRDAKPGPARGTCRGDPAAEARGCPRPPPGRRDRPPWGGPRRRRRRQRTRRWAAPRSPAASPPTSKSPFDAPRALSASISRMWTSSRRLISAASTSESISRMSVNVVSRASWTSAEMVRVHIGGLLAG